MATNNDFDPKDITCLFKGTDKVWAEYKDKPVPYAVIRDDYHNYLIAGKFENGREDVLGATYRDGNKILLGAIDGWSKSFIPVSISSKPPFNTPESIEVVAATMKRLGIKCTDGNGNIVTPVISYDNVKKLDENRGTPVSVSRK